VVAETDQVPPELGRGAVLDEAGFELDRCRPITADVTGAEVRWQGGERFNSLNSKPARLRFGLAGAKRYAFSGVRRVVPEEGFEPPTKGL
jgi:hypothetical protein